MGTSNTPALSRRGAIATIASAATSIAVLSSFASATAEVASAPHLTTSFRNVYERYRQAKETLERVYAENTARQEALDAERPNLPRSLLHSLDLPGKGLTDAPDKGWPEDDLRRLAAGKWFVVERYQLPDRAEDVFYTRARYLEVPYDLQQNARMLLEDRLSYDQQYDQWWENVADIEDATAEAFAEFFGIAGQFFESHVCSLAELRLKLEVMQSEKCLADGWNRNVKPAEIIARDVMLLPWCDKDWETA